jgi:hypothetical protein
MSAILAVLVQNDVNICNPIGKQLLVFFEVVERVEMVVCGFLKKTHCDIIKLRFTFWKKSFGEL